MASTEEILKSMKELMNVLILGGGGRGLLLKISQSSLCKKLFNAFGNLDRN